jgi:hypothetical protein
MTEKQKHTHAPAAMALLAVGLAAALVFGALVLASGDWLPGTIIVVAAAVGLVREVPALRRLRGAARPPTGTPG